MRVNDLINKYTTLGTLLAFLEVSLVTPLSQGERALVRAPTLTFLDTLIERATAKYTAADWRDLANDLGMGSAMQNEMAVQLELRKRFCTVFPEIGNQLRANGAKKTNATGVVAPVSDDLKAELARFRARREGPSAA